jgi:ribonuclease T2
MIVHEWEKHGACSGLEATAYFELSNRMRRSVVIPAAYTHARTIGAQEVPRLKQEFLAVNRGLPTDGITTVTANHVLTEVRFCVTKEGVFRSCAAA